MSYKFILFLFLLASCNKKERAITFVPPPVKEGKRVLVSNIPDRAIYSLEEEIKFDTIIRDTTYNYRFSFTTGKVRIDGIEYIDSQFTLAVLLKKDIEKIVQFLHPDEIWLLIKKTKFTLYVYKGDTLLEQFPVCIGKNPGDKERVGDMRTPEGYFYITEIQDSHTWVHDFKDGKGPIKGAYGPFFLRLYTGRDATFSRKRWTGIGIHGTHKPESVGTRDSEGCIRLRNEDLLRLLNTYKITKGTDVLIIK